MSRRARTRNIWLTPYMLTMCVSAAQGIGFAIYQHWTWIGVSIVGIASGVLTGLIDMRKDDEIAAMRKIIKGNEYTVEQLRKAFDRERAYNRDAP